MISYNYNLNVKNYLTESDDLKKIIRENQLTYIVSGCGMGKSYFTSNYLMTEMKVLNVNFLNTTNLQNFSDTYVEGPVAASGYDGMCNLTINVQNLNYITDFAISNIDVLVIDEIQKAYQDISYRSCCGSKLEGQIDRFIKAGKKVLVLTGTPVDDVKFLDRFVKVKVEKTEITEKDTYSFRFFKGVSKYNVYDLVDKLLEKGDTPVILANSRRSDIKHILERKGLRVGIVESDEKLVSGSTTEYIIKNQTLPKGVDVILSTSVLQEGINLLETVDERLVFITFVEDIQTPHQAVQFAGRARNQKKRLIICYLRDEELNINFLHCMYDGLQNTCVLDEANMEYEEIISSEFNGIEDWKNYLESNTTCDIKCKVFSTLISENAEDKAFKTDWCEIAKVVLKEKDTKWKAKILCESVPYKIETRENGIKWLFTDNAKKAKTLISAVENGFIKEAFSEGLDDYLELYRITRTIIYILKNKNSETYYNTIGDWVSGLIGEDRFFTLYKELMKITYTENGKEVSASDIKDGRLKRDTLKRIDKPYELLVKYVKTVKSILAMINPFLNINLSLQDRLELLSTETIFKAEYESNTSTTRKGVYAKDKFCLSSDCAIKFKSRKEAYEYCVDNGLTDVTFKSFERTNLIKRL